jgi:hypothetical protein
VDKTAPTIALTAPPTGTTVTEYVLNQPVPADYACSDPPPSGVSPAPAVSGVATCVGTVPDGANINTATVGTKTFTVNASDRADNVSTSSTIYNVAYRICLLYDPAQAQTIGSAYVIKLQICDWNGKNYSSPTITLTALKIVPKSGVGGPVDAGSANPDELFRYDAELVKKGNVSEGGYIYNLKPIQLAPGSYVLTFMVSGDPVEHQVPFTFRAR